MIPLASLNQSLHFLNQTMKGYECTKILTAILLMGLKGLKMYKAGVALKRKIAFLRFNTMKV